MAKFWIHHVHISTPDPVTAAEFYEKTVGAKRVTKLDLPVGPVFILDLNGVGIAVTRPIPRQVTNSEGKTTGVIEQYGMGTDDLDSALADLKAGGAKPVGDVITSPTGGRVTFFLTPHHVLVELIERKQPSRPPS